MDPLVNLATFIYQWLTLGLISLKQPCCYQWQRLCPFEDSLDTPIWHQYIYMEKWRKNNTPSSFQFCMGQYISKNDTLVHYLEVSVLGSQLVYLCTNVSCFCRPWPSHLDTRLSHDVQLCALFGCRQWHVVLFSNEKPFLSSSNMAC